MSTNQRWSKRSPGSRAFQSHPRRVASMLDPLRSSASCSRSTSRLTRVKGRRTSFRPAAALARRTRLFRPGRAANVGVGGPSLPLKDARPPSSARVATA